MSPADQVSGAGDGGGRAIKQRGLQLCLKTHVKKCKELLWFVSCSHIRLRMEDVSLHRSVLLHGSRKQQECTSVWDSDMERSCAFLV